MVVEPRVKDYICTTAHPIGCAQNVKNQIAYVKSKGVVKNDNAPKKVLVIGASTGYGLASRIAVAFGYGADTLGVMFEKESNGRRTATAGFYNTRASEEEAHAAGLYAKSINGDAFSQEIKDQVVDGRTEPFRYFFSAGVVRRVRLFLANLCCWVRMNSSLSASCVTATSSICSPFASFVR